MMRQNRLSSFGYQVRPTQTNPENVSPKSAL
jgi:hypothetical protein